MQLYTYTCRNILNTITTSKDTSLEKYTSHFIESVVYERELETEQRLQHIHLPSSSGHSSVSFLFSWAAQPGAWGSALSWELVLSARSRTLLQALNCDCPIGGPDGPLCWVLFSLQHPFSNWLKFLCTELYNSSTSTFFLVGVTNHTQSTPPRSRLYSDITRPDEPVIYTGAFPILTAQLGRRSIYNKKSFALCEWQPLIASPECSTAGRGVYILLDRLYHCITTLQCG